MRTAIPHPTPIPTLADVESLGGGSTGYDWAMYMLGIATVVVITVGVDDVDKRVSVTYIGGKTRSVVRLM